MDRSEGKKRELITRKFSFLDSSCMKAKNERIRKEWVVWKINRDWEIEESRFEQAMFIFKEQLDFS